jgi:hypothetical protein
MTNNRAMVIHYRSSPWIGGHPTLCGRIAAEVSYTDHVERATCGKCLQILGRGKKAPGTKGAAKAKGAPGARSAPGKILP